MPNGGSDLGRSQGGNTILAASRGGKANMGGFQRGRRSEFRPGGRRRGSPPPVPASPPPPRCTPDGTGEQVRGGHDPADDLPSTRAAEIRADQAEGDCDLGRCFSLSELLRPRLTSGDRRPGLETWLWTRPVLRPLEASSLLRNSPLGGQTPPPLPRPAAARVSDRARLPAAARSAGLDALQGPLRLSPSPPPGNAGLLPILLSPLTLLREPGPLSRGGGPGSPALLPSGRKRGLLPPCPSPSSLLRPDRSSQSLLLAWPPREGGSAAGGQMPRCPIWGGGAPRACE